MAGSLPIAFGNEIFNNIDLVWIPVAMVTVHEGQRIKAAVFCAACYIFLRLQIETLESFGFPNGMFGLLNMDLFMRGLLTYGLMTTIFLLLSIWSPGARGVIFMAACISLFFTAVLVSTVVLVL